MSFLKKLFQPEIRCPQCGRLTRTDVMKGKHWCSWGGGRSVESM